MDSGKEGSSNLDPTTVVLATGLSTPLGGQRRYDSSNRTLLLDLVDPQTTGSPSGTIRSQRLLEDQNELVALRYRLCNESDTSVPQL